MPVQSLQLPTLLTSPPLPGSKRKFSDALRSIPGRSHVSKGVFKVSVLLKSPFAMELQDRFYRLNRIGSKEQRRAKMEKNSPFLTSLEGNHKKGIVSN